MKHFVSEDLDIFWVFMGILHSAWYIVDKDKMSQNLQINCNWFDYLPLTQNIELTFFEFDVLSTRNHVEQTFKPTVFFLH